MPNIKPISDLRNYSAVLLQCRDGEPVYLTRNGRGKYVLLDIKEYERMQQSIKQGSVASTPTVTETITELCLVED